MYKANRETQQFRAQSTKHTDTPLKEQKKLLF